jgi:pectate lyase
MRFTLEFAAVWCFTVAVQTAAYCAADAPLPAFPQAEGFGAEAVGGRGGRVIEVTNLHDEGRGSLRAAVSAKGPRIVVFRVAGTIELRTEMVLTESFITIAGQTAPGEGVTLKTHADNPRSALTIKGGAHDVVIRHLRFRPGPSQVRAVAGDDSHVKDGLQILDASRVIVDHCSLSWATDEVLSTWYDAHDVTIQRCLIAEALRNAERGGPDGKALLIGGKGAGRISVHHNLLAHSMGRNPMVKAEGVVDVVNNVALVPGTVAMSVDGEYGRTPVNFVGNRVLAPQSDGLAFGVRVLGPRPVSLFARDNLGPRRTSAEQDELLFVDAGNEGRSHAAAARHDAPPVTTLPAAELLEHLLSDVGCTRPARDAVDERILRDVRAGRSRAIGDPAEVGGWPELKAGEPAADADHDGMPDAWETAHKFNPADASDGPLDADGDGYTNLEEFLNATAPHGV